jgi:hypothetical protein
MARTCRSERNVTSTNMALASAGSWSSLSVYGAVSHSRSYGASSQRASGCSNGASRPARMCRNSRTCNTAPPEQQERRRWDFTGQNWLS